MKRRGILIVLFTLASILLIGQNSTQYVVDETDGIVKVKYDDSGIERKVKRNAKLNSSDLIILEEGGYISFYNSEKNNNTLYEWNSKGSYTVRQIVKSHGENSCFKTFFSFLLNKGSEKKKDNRDFHNINGIKRSVPEIEPDNYEKAIASLIQSTLFSGDNKQFETNNGIMLEKVLKTPKVFSFQFTNSTNDTLYMNVFRIQKNGLISCCFDIVYREENVGRKPMSIFVPDHCRVEFPNYTFVNDKSTYLLVGTKHPFDAVFVENLVNDSVLDITSGDYEWFHYYIMKGKR